MEAAACLPRPLHGKQWISLWQCNRDPCSSEKPCFHTFISRQTAHTLALQHHNTPIQDILALFVYNGTKWRHVFIYDNVQWKSWEWRDLSFAFPALQLIGIDRHSLLPAVLSRGISFSFCMHCCSRYVVYICVCVCVCICLLWWDTMGSGRTQQPVNETKLQLKVAWVTGQEWGANGV